MDIDWKNLSFAMITSVIVTGISGLILSLSNIILAYQDIYEYLKSINIYDTNVSLTIAETSTGPPFVLHLWLNSSSPDLFYHANYRILFHIKLFEKKERNRPYLM